MHNATKRRVSQVRISWEDMVMRKNGYRIFSCLLCVILMWVFAFNFVYASTKIPSVTKEFFVNDFAEVFTEVEKEKIIETSKRLTEYNDIKFVISTVKTLDGDNVDKFAETMYNQYLGEDGFGALILLVTEEKKVHIEVGSLMEPHVDKAEIEQLIEKYAKVSVENGKFGAAMIELQKWLISYIMNEAFFPTLEDMDVEFTDNSNKLDNMIEMVAIGIAVCIIIIVAILIFVKVRRK